MRLRFAAALVTFSVLAAACGGTDDPPAAESTTEAPSTTSTTTTEAPQLAGVSADPIFDVEHTTGIVYAQAQRHAEWQSEELEVIDLTLDVFEPVDGPDTPRPVLVMIHGGGFFNGDSSVAPMVDMATWFAERGWVAFSINYRLAGDRGTLPSSLTVNPEPLRLHEQLYAMYTACRDAKAAIRWVRANAETYGLDTERITAGGGSAGSFAAVALGVVDEADCKDELTLDEDPTLLSTNLGESSQVHTVIDHWGSAGIVSLIETLGGDSRFDPTDAPISIVHGTADPTVAFDRAEQLEAAYAETGVPYAYYPLEGAGHGP